MRTLFVWKSVSDGARHVGALVVSILVLFPPVAAGQAAENAVGTVGPATVWITPGSKARIRDPWILLRYHERQEADAPISIEVEVRSEGALGERRIAAEIFDENETTVFEGELFLDVEEGATVGRFWWSLDSLPDGRYTARVTLWRTNLLMDSVQELVVRKLSPATVSAVKARAGSRVKTFLEHLHERGMVNSAYHDVRVKLLEDYSVYLEKAPLDSRLTYDISSYLLDTVRSLSAQIAFGARIGELADARVPKPEPQIAIKNGSFFDSGRPSFLLGFRSSEPNPRVIERAARYGLRSSAFEITPKDTILEGLETANFRPRFQPVLDAAKAANIKLNWSLAPHELGDRSITGGRTEGGVDIFNPQVRNLMKAHLGAASDYLGASETTLGISLLETPSFHLRGPEVRNAFSSYVENYYQDRFTLNRSWNTRFADFGQVDIWADAPSSAYHYDWQTFHQQLVTEFVKELIDAVRSQAGETPLQIEFDDTMFLPNSARNGLDHEELLEVLDFAAANVIDSAVTERYGFDFVPQTLLYTFLGSLSENKPIYNWGGFTHYESERYESYTFPFVHSSMWEGVITGMDGMSTPAPVFLDDQTAPGGTPFQRPECLDAYLTASVDFQRLAPIIQEFQTAPAEVAILWSPPSAIHNGGDPYLASLVNAYEGTSQANRKVRFISEEQCAEGQLSSVRVLVLPKMVAIGDAAFAAVEDYINNRGVQIRTTSPIPFDAWGKSRDDSFSTNFRTFYLTGDPSPTDFSHAMDAVDYIEDMPFHPMAVNPFDFPLEGVKTRHVELDGEHYLYLINLRKEPVEVYLTGTRQGGRELIRGNDVEFPRLVAPMRPMLIQLGDSVEAEEVETDEILTREDEPTEESDEIPSAVIRPVEQIPG